jgi:hypothetical protein
MKILIKTADSTHLILASGKQQAHCGNYCAFLFRDAFRALGHTVKFIGPQAHNDDIVYDPTGWDMVFCWGLESFTFDKEYTTQMLQNFKGKKVLYITTKTSDPIVKLFDLVIGSDVEAYRKFYGDKTLILPFSGPLPELIDKDATNPYKDRSSFRVIYTGIMTDRYLKVLNHIASSGFDLYVAGIRNKAGEKYCRRFTLEELAKELHPRIKPLSIDGALEYGTHFKYLKYAHCGICLYPGPDNAGQSASSKLTDYTMCGLPVVCEDASPNAFVLKILDAGYTCKWGNEQDLLEKLVVARNTKWNRPDIIKQARVKFDSVEIARKICQRVTQE